MQNIQDIIKNIPDPEIPVLTISELGILRDVKRVDDEWHITITPTYSGCPALDMIESIIHSTLRSKGLEHYKVITQLSPAWTTEWMTDEAKRKLEDYGIAPPNDSSQNQPRRCPQCGSDDVEEVSRFGSTACKAMWKCKSCLEPFEYFKCH